jgi:hypothetical protein
MAAIPKQVFTQVVILLICGVGMGFGLQTLGKLRTEGSAAPHQGETKPSAGTIEEQFAAALKHRNEENQKQASRAIFARLGVDELAPLAATVEKFTAAFSESEGGDGGWILCNEFYTRWGELAPAEALRFLKDHESFWAGQIESVWTAWARTHPDAAVAAYDPKLEEPNRQSLREAILDGLCAADPAKALRFADAQEMGNDFLFNPEDDEMHDRHAAWWDLLEYVPVERPRSTFGQAIYSWCYRDPQGALEAMLPLHYNLLQRAALGALFSNWMMYDPEAALLALKKITDRGLRESTTHTAMQAYLLRHPRAAFPLVIGLPKYVHYRYPDGFDPFADVDPALAPKPVEMDKDDENEALPFRYGETMGTTYFGRMDLISEAGASLGIAEGKAAWETALAVEDKSKRAAALGGVLAGWLIFAPEEAVRFAAEGIADHSFEGPGGPEFPLLAARLVSKHLAKRDFKQAVAWVGALPAGPLRDAGIDTACQVRLDLAWYLAQKEASPDGGVNPLVFEEVRKREYAPVSEWLASLPPSKGRDEATYWLVFRLEDLDDLGAALKWAATIEDPRLRRIRFESLAKKLFPQKGASGSAEFDFDAWSASHPELTEELKRELARKKTTKGGSDEK